MQPRKEGHDKVPDASLMLLRPSARSVFVALTHQIEWRVGLSEEPIRAAQAVDESFFILFKACGLRPAWRAGASETVPVASVVTRQQGTVPLPPRESVLRSSARRESPPAWPAPRALASAPG